MLDLRLGGINHVSAKAGAEADACQEWRSGPLAPSWHYCSAPSRDLDRQGPGLAQAARVLSTPAGLEKRSPGPGNRSVFAATGAGRERIGRLLARQPLGLAAAEHSGSRLTDGRSRGRVHRRSSLLRSQQESWRLYFGLVPSQDQSGEYESARAHHPGGLHRGAAPIGRSSLAGACVARRPCEPITNASSETTRTARKSR